VFFKLGVKEHLAKRAISIPLPTCLVGVVVLCPAVGRLHLPLSTLQVVSIVLLLTMPFAFELLKNNRYDRCIGNLAYPIYVGHFMIINHLSWRLPGAWQLPAIILVAVVIGHGLMEPLEKLALRPGSLRPAPVPAV